MADAGTGAGDRAGESQGRITLKPPEVALPAPVRMYAKRQFI